MTSLLCRLHGKLCLMPTLSFVNSALLLTSILTFLSAKLWNKGLPYGTIPFGPSISLPFCFYPFLLGSPIDNWSFPTPISFCKLDSAVLTRAKRIAKLPLPYTVPYRRFTSLVSTCYNHYALSCYMSSSQNVSFKRAINTILAPKRSRWVCREALYSLITPGHLLSPQLFSLTTGML